MELLINIYILFKRLFFIAVGLFIFLSTTAQPWPTASEQAENMNIGWNLGNSLEVSKNYGGETGWGNVATTQRLIDSVHNAGFDLVRIPCAWNSYADQESFEIEATWLARVKQVVDYCLNNDMFVIINSHWDGGWLEENPFYHKQEEVNEKHEAYWTQIANHFMDYDSRLLFAGTNEVRANYGTPTSEHIEVQESFNQTFIDAVRATGGNNTHRNLIVQVYNTNIGHGLNYFTLPNDSADSHLMVEVHYYDPYCFTIEEVTTSYEWGAPFSPGSCNWGQEAYANNVFNNVKEKWIDQGYPVIMGEYGVMHRKALSGEQLERHTASRNYWLEHITGAAIEHGMIPVYWDNGWNGNNGFALFNRGTGAVVNEDALNALRYAAGIAEPPTRYTLKSTTSGSGKISLNPGSVIYEEGTDVTLTASGNYGWSFDFWNGDHQSTENPTTITMDNNYEIRANFIPWATDISKISRNSVLIYPNPVVNGRLRVDLNALDGISFLRVLDMNGRIIEEKEVVNTESIELIMNVTPGLYILQIVNNNRTISKKFSVQ